MHWSKEDGCKWFACQSCMPFDPFYMIRTKISSAWLPNLKRNCQNDKIQSAKIGTRSKKNELRVVLTYRWVPNNYNQFAQSWIFQSFLHRHKTAETKTINGNKLGEVTITISHDLWIKWMFGVCTNDAEITSSSQNAMLPLIEKVIESRTQINFYWQKINITVKVFPIIPSKLFIEDFNKVAFNLVNSSESNINLLVLEMGCILHDSIASTF